MARQNASLVFPTNRLPTHIRDRDVVAQRAGLSIIHTATEEKLHSAWSGSEEQFRSTGLFTEQFKFRNSNNVHHRYIRFGSMGISEGEISLSLVDDRPLTIAFHPECSAIEVLTYEDRSKTEHINRVAYYGNSDDLLRYCVVNEHGRLRKNIYRKSGWDAGTKRHWDARRIPNGKMFVEFRTYLDEQVSDEPSRFCLSPPKQLDLDGEGEERRLRALLRDLPPFDGKLDEVEICHLRMLRALSDRSYNCVTRFTKGLLVNDADDGRLVQPLRTRRLELVVNNDASPQA